MKKAKLSDVLGLYLLAAIAVAGLLGYFAIKPLINKAQLTAAEVTKVDHEIKALEQLKSDTEQLRSTYAAVKTERDAILKLLPVKNEEERLLVLLNTLALESGVVMSTFSPADPGAASVPALSIYGANLSVSGNYASLQKFLERMENSARFIDVISIDMSGSVATGGATTLGIALRVDAYYQGEIAAVAATPTATGGAK